MNLSAVWVAMNGEGYIGLYLSSKAKATFVYFSKEKKPLKDLCVAFSKTGKPGYKPILLDSKVVQKMVQKGITVHFPYGDCPAIGMVELFACKREPVDGLLHTTLTGTAILA